MKVHPPEGDALSDAAVMHTLNHASPLHHTMHHPSEHETRALQRK